MYTLSSTMSMEGFCMVKTRWGRGGRGLPPSLFFSQETFFLNLHKASFLTYIEN